MNEQFENQCEANFLLSTDFENSEMENEDNGETYFVTKLVLSYSELKKYERL